MYWEGKRGNCVNCVCTHGEWGRTMLTLFVNSEEWASKNSHARTHTHVLEWATCWSAACWSSAATENVWLNKSQVFSFFLTNYSLWQTDSAVNLWPNSHFLEAIIWRGSSTVKKKNLADKIVVVDDRNFPILSTDTDSNGRERLQCKFLFILKNLTSFLICLETDK